LRITIGKAVLQEKPSALSEYPSLLCFRKDGRYGRSDAHQQGDLQGLRPVRGNMPEPRHDEGWRGHRASSGPADSLLQVPSMHDCLSESIAVEGLDYSRDFFALPRGSAGEMPFLR